jgi:hypothetical protein
VVAALGDRVASRRFTAAEALCQAGAAGQVPELARLLKDPRPAVRLRVGLALAAAHDKEAVPVLIDLLGELPLEQAWQAEDVLRQLADGRGPDAALGEDAAARKKAREQWAAWWQDNRERADLAGLGARQRLLGYTLLAMYNNLRNSSQVVEIGPDKKPRWNIDNLNYAFDAQVLPGDRVLIPEYSSGRVTERTFKGQILWTYNVNAPITAQRLPNGNTFIASRNQLLEVDRANRVLYTISRPNHDVMAAQKLRDGQVAFVTQAGTYIRTDTAGKEKKSFSVGNVQTYGSFDTLPRGGVVVAQQWNNRVVEFDADGKEVKQFPVQFPTSVTRLPNGHTLVASQNTRQILELDRKGKEVWRYQSEGQVWRVRRR